MKETWKPVVGRETEYEVSDLGKVRSLDRSWKQLGNGGKYYTRNQKGKMLKPGLASSGYPTVALGRGRTKTVHSLVAEAFIGPRPEGCEVRHKNGVRDDPRACNLEYGTRTENIYDAVKHGTWMSERRYKSLSEHCRRMTKQRVARQKGGT
jgi:hypothetical protein